MLVHIGLVVLSLIEASAMVTPDASSLESSIATQTIRAAGPLKISASNPRYFDDGSGKIVYLTGSHTWDNFLDWGAPTPDFDYTAYLDFLRSNNHNFIRLWARESTCASSGALSDISPLPWQRTGPGRANDGKPKFNLRKFNRDYFERLRSRIIKADKRGIYVSIMLFNRFSDWSTHPFNISNNINGINGDLNGDGDPREIHTLANPEITGLQKAYVKKVVDTVNDLNNVLYEIGNELRRDTIEWQYNMIKFIHDYEATLPNQHLVGMTSTGGGSEAITNSELLESPADWISPRTEPGQNYSHDPPAGDGRKVIITDTDHLYGVLEDPTPDWVWRSFLRGLNPIVMDVIQNAAPGHNANWNKADDALLPDTRSAMGETLLYANRINLKKAFPRNDLASSGYCLANSGTQYLVYLPFSGIKGRGKRILRWLSRFTRNKSMLHTALMSMGLNESVTVDLSRARGALGVEWFSPITGETEDGVKTTGGTVREFTAPFSGDAVLYISADYQ